MKKIVSLFMVLVMVLGNVALAGAEEPAITLTEDGILETEAENKTEVENETDKEKPIEDEINNLELGEEKEDLTEEPKIVTFSFYLGEEKLKTVKVANGKHLVPMKNPIKDRPGYENYIFLYWALDNEEFDFDKAIDASQVDTEKEIRLDAKIEKRFRIDFDYKGQIVDTSYVEDGGYLEEKDYSHILDDGEYLIAWMEEGKVFDFSTPITKNYRLVASLAKKYKVTFDSMGGSGIEDIYLKEGENLASENLENPKKNRAKFLYWSLEKPTVENPNPEKYDMNQVVDKDLDLYAVWQEVDTAQYQVTYWLENANNDKYKIFKVEMAEGKIGQLTNPRKLDTKDLEDIDGFTPSLGNKNEVIKDDGSTTINVYYQRKQYSLVFKTDILGIPLTSGRVKYGQKANDLWDKVNGFTEILSVSGVWQDRRDGKIYSEAPLMPNRDMTLHYSIKDSSLAANTNINFIDSSSEYIANPYLPDTKLIKLKDGQAYEIQDNIEGYRFLKAEGGQKDNDKKDLVITYDDFIKGNTKIYKRDTGFGKKDKIDIYYERLKFKLTFIDGLDKQEIFTEDVYYEKKLSGLNLPNTQIGDEREKEGKTYIFKGWYTNEDFTGGSVDIRSMDMPGEDLTFYSRWLAKDDPNIDGSKLEVKIHKNRLLDSVYDIVYVDKGSTINSKDLEKYDIPNGLTKNDFKGWYQVVNGNFEKVDTDKPIYKDKEIYPLFKNSLTIKYVDKESEAPEDTNVYSFGSYAVVKDHKEKEGFVFIGWLDKSDLIKGGFALYPEKSRIYMDGNKELEAVYKEENQKALVTYKPGEYGTSDPALEDKTFLVDNKINYTILNPSELDFGVVGKKIIGWKYEADQKIYQPGEILNLNNENEHIFTAQWAEDTVDIAISINWVNDQERPNFVVKFDGGPSELDRKLTLNSTKHKILNLPRADKNGQAYDYRLSLVEEESKELIENYTTVIKDDTTVVNEHSTVINFTITNTNKRIKLSYFPGNYGETNPPLEEKIFFLEKDKQYTILDPKNEELNYRVEGKKFTGWRDGRNGKIYQPGDKLPVDGRNEYRLVAQWEEVVEPEKTSIEIFKKWEGGEGFRPDHIKVKVYADGIYYDTYTMTGEKDDWSLKIYNLNKYNDSGKEIVYSIEEVKVKDFISKVDGLTITNSYEGEEVPSPEPEKTSIEIFKKWEGGEDFRPDHIKVKVYADGIYYDTYTMTGNKDDWSLKIYNLNKYNDSGKEIVYSIEEVKVKDFVSKVDGLTITNSYEGEEVPPSGKIDIKIENNWYGSSNTRPKEVTVNLYRNGILYKTIVMTGENNMYRSLPMAGGNDSYRPNFKPRDNNKWVYWIRGLDKYDENGSLYSYTIDQEPIEDYITEINGFTITNIYNGDKLLPDNSIKPEGSIKDEHISDNPITGDMGLANYGWLLGLSLVLILILRKKKEDKQL